MGKRIQSGVAAILVIAYGLLCGAREIDLPVFETASIKRTLQDGPTGPIPPDRFIRRGATLSTLAAFAYDVFEFQVEGPTWTRNVEFDVAAKAENRPSGDQMRLMVRRLLTERFDLATHLETREMPRYALVLARADRRLGPKLLRSAVDCPTIVASRSRDYRAPSGPPHSGDAPRCALMARIGGGSVTMMMEGQPISRLIGSLQSKIGRIIVDKTGLDGTHDIELETETDFP